MSEYIVVGKRGLSREEFKAQEHVGILQAYGACVCHEYVNMIVIKTDDATARILEEKGYILRRSQPLSAKYIQMNQVRLEQALGTPITELVRRFVADLFHSVGWRGRGWICAILDSGVRSTHIALRNKILLSESVIPELPPEDRLGHGTHVATSAVGYAPEIGLIGVAPDAQLISIRVLNDEGIGSDVTVIRGIDRVIELANTRFPRQIMTINLSLGRPPVPPPDPLEVAATEAIKNAIAVVAAAGNRGPAPQTIDSPASTEHAVAVASAKLDLTISEFSSRGPTAFTNLIKPDITSYGENIIAGGAFSDTSLVSLTGTSAAAPQITGGTLIVGQSIFGLPQNRPVFRTFEELIETARRFVNEVLVGLAGKPDFWPIPPGVKDTTYGWGIAALQQQFQRSLTNTFLNNLLIPAMVLATLTPLIQPPTKAM